MKKTLQITWKVTPTAKGRRIHCRTLYNRQSIPINGTPLETLTEVFGRPVSHTSGPNGSTTTIFDSSALPTKPMDFTGIRLTGNVRRHCEEAWEGLPA